MIRFIAYCESALQRFGELGLLPRTTPPFQETNAAKAARTVMCGQICLSTLRGLHIAAITRLTAVKSISALISACAEEA